MDNGLQEPQGYLETIKERKEKSDPPGQEKDNDNSNKPDTPPGLENKGKNDKDKGLEGEEELPPRLD